MFGRKRVVPLQVRADLTSRFSTGEMVEAASRAGDEYVVATQFGLWHWVPGAEPRSWPWHRIDHARWDETRLTVTMEDGDSVVFALDQEGALPRACYDRINASIVYNQTAAIGPGRKVRLVGRRDGAADRVVWRVIYDDGVDRTDPRVRAVVTDLVERAKTLD